MSALARDRKASRPLANEVIHACAAGREIAIEAPRITRRLARVHYKLCSAAHHRACRNALRRRALRNGRIRASR